MSTNKPTFGSESSLDSPVRSKKALWNFKFSVWKLKHGEHLESHNQDNRLKSHLTEDLYTTEDAEALETPKQTFYFIGIWKPF